MAKFRRLVGLFTLKGGGKIACENLKVTLGINRFETLDVYENEIMR